MQGRASPSPHLFIYLHMDLWVPAFQQGFTNLSFLASLESPMQFKVSPLSSIVGADSSCKMKPPLGDLASLSEPQSPIAPTVPPRFSLEVNDHRLRGERRRGAVIYLRFLNSPPPRRLLPPSTIYM